MEKTYSLLKAIAVDLTRGGGGNARLSRWHKGTYVFRGMGDGREVIMMVRKNRLTPYIIPFTISYMESVAFIPGTGLEKPYVHCIHCQEIKYLAKYSKPFSVRTKSQISHLKWHCKQSREKSKCRGIEINV